MEHAKASPEDILCRVTVHNRSAADAVLHVLPTLWFRNTWSWAAEEPKPRLARVDAAHPVVRADDHQTGVFYLYAEPEAELLFCENETNAARVFGAEPATPSPRTASATTSCTARTPSTPTATGTKAAAHVRLQVPGGGQARCWCGSLGRARSSSRRRSPEPTN